MKALLFVSLGGFFGSAMRYLVSGIYPQIKGFPFGTFLVNVFASLILGFIMGLNYYKQFLSPNMRLLFATGFCGGFSTYSTFAYESLRLLQQKQLFILTLNVIFNTVFAIVFAYLGFYFALKLTR